MQEPVSERNSPVTVHRPAGAAVPVVFDSPHSGRDYPADFAPLVPVQDLHGYEDRLVDALLADAPEHGVVLVTAGFPRAYVDPNRAADDLDRHVAGADWTDPIAPTVYSERGLGLVFRTALDGSPIYAGPLARADLTHRIERLWRPYHDALEAELARAQARWGAVWHVDWHSMRPVGDALAPDPGEVRADFVLGDLGGTSAEAAFSDHVEAALAAMGYSVARNRPFQGGYITARHGRPAEGRHSVQIEINRALYLDMETLALSPGAEALKRDLAAFARGLAAWAAARVTAS
ncbi:MAG: N-formylglutamate amidohydrolase [Allosphingosinicella sp.]